LTIFADIPIDQYAFQWLQYNPFPMLNLFVLHSRDSDFYFYLVARELGPRVTKCRLTDFCKNVIILKSGIVSAHFTWLKENQCRAVLDTRKDLKVGCLHPVACTRSVCIYFRLKMVIRPKHVAVTE
jgi:hypothetical protein